MCIACCKKNPVGNAQKGSRKPIWSLSFRERFELDLMDFCKLRKKGPFGVLMHWILTLKDHSTALVHLCALPRKWANFIADKLQEVFGVIDYLKIFHTDNGIEFTARNILTVTGRPHRPSVSIRRVKYLDLNSTPILSCQS
jgi:hypothetical protein